MNNLIVKKIHKLIKNNINLKNKIFLHEPNIDKHDKKNLINCAKSSFVSTVGTYSNKFEKKLKKITGSKYIIPTVNGTSALHAILFSLKIDHNHEVIIPSLTFVGTANAIKYCGAEPNFVDVSKKTFGIDPVKLEKYLKAHCKIRNNICFNKKTKKKIKALICVHVFGHAAEILEIKNICKKYKLILIEDAAEAIGSYYKDKHLGIFGEYGMISFNGNKIVTTGGGGAILTNNKEIYLKLLKLITVNKEKHEFEYFYKSIGFNYKMPSINASLGLGQLNRIKQTIQKKRKIFMIYEKIFKNFKGVKILKEPINCKSNYWLNTIILDKEYVKYKNKIIKKLIYNNFLCRPLWFPLHLSPHFKKSPRDKLDTTIDLYNRSINLPSSISILNNFK
tara:strand:+ start:1228 stop:2403 length:1176 start_codon:yes stop_codon:yes gene_type:complete